jgi:hypothetical protein
VKKLITRGAHLAPGEGSNLTAAGKIGAQKRRGRGKSFCPSACRSLQSAAALRSCLHSPIQRRTPHGTRSKEFSILIRSTWLVIFFACISLFFSYFMITATARINYLIQCENNAALCIIKIQLKILSFNLCLCARCKMRREEFMRAEIVFLCDLFPLHTYLKCRRYIDLHLNFPQNH